MNEMQSDATAQKLEQQEKTKPFEIFVENPQNCSPNLQIGWCVSEQTAEELKNKQILHPFIFICIFKKDANDQWSDCERFLLPLEKGIVYLELYEPNRHLINASIVWSDLKNEQTAHLASHLLKKEKGSYEQKLSYGEKYEPEMLPVPSLHYHKSIEIAIDESLFAPEPPSWLKNWVNLPYSEKPKNQCQWRKRMLFSLPANLALSASVLFFGVIAIVLKCVLFPIAAIFAIVFFRKRPAIFDWELAVHPFKTLGKNKVFLNEYSWYPDHNDWGKVASTGRKRYPLERFLLSPLRMLFFSLAITIAGEYTIASYLPFLAFAKNNSFDSFFLTWATYFIEMVVVFFPSALLGVWVVHKYFQEDGRLKRKIDEEEEERRKKAEEEERKLQRELSFYYDQKVVPLACSKIQRKPSLENLPESHQTMRLKIDALKASKCKPFRL